MRVLLFEQRELLTFQFQKELAKDRNATAFAIRYDVVNSDTIASDIRNDAVNTPTIVSDIRRNTFGGSEDTRSQDLRVSTTRALLATE
jgi:hypothetical protein